MAGIVVVVSEGVHRQPPSGVELHGPKVPLSVAHAAASAMQLGGNTRLAARWAWLTSTAPSALKLIEPVAVMSSCEVMQPLSGTMIGGDTQRELICQVPAIEPPQGVNAVHVPLPGSDMSG